MTPVLWEDDEPDQRGRIPGTAKHVKRTGKRLMASGTTGDIPTACMHCGKGLTHSDDVLMALDPDGPRSHGLHPGRCAEEWEAERMSEYPNTEVW